MAQQIMNVQSAMVIVPKMQSARLAGRRLVAWSLEVSLVVMGAVVPWGLGQYGLALEASTSSESVSPVAIAEETTTDEEPAQNPLELMPMAGSIAESAVAPVPLNPLLQGVQQQWARVAQIPPYRLHRTVPRITNALWLVALVAPVLVAGGQIVQLSRTGSTLPKRWLGLHVISSAGGPLKVRQILGRELVRWGGALGIVGGVALVANVSLGTFTPVAIGLLAVVEGLTIVAPSGRPWHDRIAKTRVTVKTAGYLPLSREPLVYSLPIGGNFLPADGLSDGLATGLAPNGNSVKLYGESEDDDWWLTESEGNLTSIVLAPRASQTAGGDLISVPRTNPSSQRFWQFLAGGMALACAAGFGVGRLTQFNVSRPIEEDIFWQTAQSLSNNAQSGGDHRAAILMLAQVDDPRTDQYLTDLLSQSSQPDALAAIQQALVSQGLESLAPLLALSRVLDNELQQPLTAQRRQMRLEQRHVVQGAIAKLLTIHSDDLVGIQLDRVNLGLYQDANRTFRLIQPELLAAGTSWQGANLKQANLAGASFFDVGADGKVGTFDDQISDLRGINLVAARLENANLHGVQLSQANLRRTNFTGANLTYGNLDQAQLTNARLVNVAAPKSRWQGSNLVGADLTQAQLDRADLSQARLNRIEASHSSWRKATLPQSDWVGANLIGADFSQAGLSGANFQGANLDSVRFNRADLRQASLRDADLRQATLTGANLADADLAGAIFHDGISAGDSFITPNAQLSNDNGLKGVNFSQARNLDGRQLNYICAQGGIHPSCQDVSTQPD